MGCSAGCAVYGGMRLIIFFFFSFLILSSLVNGFDCSYFEDENDCLALLEVNESLIANLIYQSSLSPDFGFIENYNSEIIIDSAPEGAIQHDSGRIRNAWFTLLSVQPSIKYENELLVDSNFTIRTAFDYSVSVPSTYNNNDRPRTGEICQIRYNLYSTNEDYALYINNNYVSNNPEQIITINNDATINPKIIISATIKNRIYEWRRRSGRWRCRYDRRTYSTSTINLQDQRNIKKYFSSEEPNFTFIYNYNNMFIGNLTEYNGNLKLIFEDSEYITNKYEYQTEFTNHPYYFLQLKIINSSSRSIQNIYYYNDLLSVSNNNDCLLECTNFFNSYTKECEENYQELILEQIELKTYSANWTLFLYLIIFIAVNYGIYVLIKNCFKKILYYN